MSDQFYVSRNPERYQKIMYLVARECVKRDIAAGNWVDPELIGLLGLYK